MADMGAKEEKAKKEKAQKRKDKTQADKLSKKLALDAQHAHDNLQSRAVSIADAGSQRQLNKFRVFPLANPAQAAAQAAATQN